MTLSKLTFFLFLIAFSYAGNQHVPKTLVLSFDQEKDQNAAGDAQVKGD